MTKHMGVCVAFVALAVCAASQGAVQRRASAPVNVSTSPAASEKGRLANLAYVAGGQFVKAKLVVYLDATKTPDGKFFNVYVRRSFDQGVTWDGPTLLSRDADGRPTGGQVVVVEGVPFFATNDKASVYAPQFHANGAERTVLVTWCSSYSPTLDTGQLPNPNQRINTAIQPPAPYECVWTARSVDAGASWVTEQLTDARRDATNTVVTGSQGNNGFAIAWQEDPLGLQPGEAEGPGDGGSGAHTTAGTNIWYTYAPSLGVGNPLLRANIVQLTDNVATPSAGGGPPTGPGASRPTLQMSGTTAAIVYEESKGGGGKNVHYHSFRFDKPGKGSAGTVVSNPYRNARRARVILQGQSSAGDSPLRVVILYRQGPATMPGAPADIILQRGLKDPLDPASTGFRPQDIEPQSAAQNVSDPGELSDSDNARAHRAVIRGSSIAVGYTHTRNMVAAEPDFTAQPTQNYNFHLRVSHDSGVTFGPARNLSGVDDANISVGEPRLVPTPGTITNPLTGVPDPGDTQDTDILHAAWGLYENDRAQADLAVVVARSSDFGATFTFLDAVPVGVGQSETQLRSVPDGSEVDILWMQEMPPAGARDVLMGTFRAEVELEQPAALPAGSSASDSRCFIATAAYGTPMADEVVYLRAFRDRWLLGSPVGRGFVATYYRLSPPVAELLRECPPLRAIVRALLAPIVWACRVLVPAAGDAAAAG